MDINTLSYQNDPNVNRLNGALSGTVNRPQNTRGDSTFPATDAFQPSEEAALTKGLVKALMEMDDIRPEKLAEGVALRDNPAYPNDAQIDELARALLVEIQ